MVLDSSIKKAKSSLKKKKKAVFHRLQNFFSNVAERPFGGHKWTIRYCLRSISLFRSIEDLGVSWYNRVFFELLFFQVVFIWPNKTTEEKVCFCFFSFHGTLYFFFFPKCVCSYTMKRRPRLQSKSKVVYLPFPPELFFRNPWQLSTNDDVKSSPRTGHQITCNALALVR